MYITALASERTENATAPTQDIQEERREGAIRFPAFRIIFLSEEEQRTQIHRRSQVAEQEEEEAKEEAKENVKEERPRPNN